VDVGCTEATDAELARMIERRSRQGEVDPDANEELWKESVRAYTARRREEMRAVLEELISDYEEQAEKYLPKGALDEQAQIDQEGEGAPPLPQERKAAAPEEGQEGRRDR
jgi:hypothetical protein